MLEEVKLLELRGGVNGLHESTEIIRNQHNNLIKAGKHAGFEDLQASC